MVTRQLNEFQTETERQLLNRLRDQHLELSDRHLIGTSDSAIEANVNDVKIWIYPDGACVIGRGTDMVFEKADYSSLEELRRAFVDKVLEVLKRR